MRTLYWRIILAVVLMVVASVAAVLYTPWFLAVRQAAVAHELSALFDRDVTVNGDVTVSIGGEFIIDVKDVSISRSLIFEDNEPRHIDEAQLGVPLIQLLAGRVTLAHLLLRGADIEIDIDTETVRLEERIAEFLHAHVAGSLVIEDVVLRILDPTNGWNQRISIEMLESKWTQQLDRVLLSLNGEFNNSPLRLAASVTNPRESAPGAPGPFELDAEILGSATEMSGVLVLSPSSASVDATINSRSDSLADLLQTFELQQALNGTGRLSGRLHGPLNRLSLDRLEAGANIEDVGRLNISGTVGDIVRGRDLDFQFGADLLPNNEGPDPRSTLIDLEISGFEGHIAGDYDEMTADSFILKTNAVSAELRDIGPISIDRITRDDQGRLGILGIRILQGPVNAPKLDLAGNITDALRLQGINVEGRIDLDAALAFSLEGVTPPDALGRLKGEVAISDTDGTFGIEAFRAEVVGSNLLSTRLELVVDELNDLDEIVFDADVDIPDFAAFAAALGVKVNTQGPLKFGGVFVVKDDVPGFRGQLLVGRTEIDADIKGKFEGDIPRVLGKIHSDGLFISDLRALWEVEQVRETQDFDDVDFNMSLLAKVVADLEIDVKKIVDGDKNAGNIRGRVGYANRRVTLDPFMLTYLGGTISTKTLFDLTERPTRIESETRIRKLLVGKLLRELRLPPMVTGSLNARFTLAARGTDMAALVNTASGRVTASIWGGTLGTDLLDLSGLNVISWLATKSRDGSARLVCASLPFFVKNGRATTNALVLETEQVQAVGSGSIDFPGNAVKMRFQPRAKNNSAVNIATPFVITGPVSDPKVELQGGAAGRVVGETLSLPLNLIGGLLGTNRNRGSARAQQPCVVPKPKSQGPR